MITFAPITTDAELRQILELQACNLSYNITPEQLADQGFLTVQHDFAILKRMNDLEQGALAKDGDQLAGYLLAMTKALRNDIPVLVPMFDAFDELYYDGKRLDTYRYIVVGQACVGEGYRGQGLFDQLYAAYRQFLAPKYDFTITEISKRNERSLRAHKRVGFEIIYDFTAPDGEAWNVVLWDWRK